MSMDSLREDTLPSESRRLSPSEGGSESRLLLPPPGTGEMRPESREGGPSDSRRCMPPPGEEATKGAAVTG